MKIARKHILAVIEEADLNAQMFGFSKVVFNIGYSKYVLSAKALKNGWNVRFKAVKGSK